MSRNKGNRTVRKRAIPFFKDAGFLVAKVEFISRYSEAQDLFVGSLDGDYTDQGFDLICIEQNRILLVQVKTNSPPTQKWYRHFAQKYGGTNLMVFCYTWYDGDGARIQHYNQDGQITELELRKNRNKDATRVVWYEPREKLNEIPNL